MSTRPAPYSQLWLLVGGNGAGKNTFHRLFLAPYGLPFVNNASADSPFRPVATIRQGLVERHADPLPGWAEALLN